MKIKISQSEFCLEKRQTLSLQGGAGVRIDARAGALWVTQDHDLRDVVLQAGESVTFDGKARVIVQALEASRLELSLPGQAGVRQTGVAWDVGQVAGRVAASEPRFARWVRGLLPQSGWA